MSQIKGIDDALVANQEIVVLSEEESMACAEQWANNTAPMTAPPISPAENVYNPAAGIKYMNGKYAVATVNNRTVVLHETYDIQWKRHAVRFMRMSDVEAWERNRHVQLEHNGKTIIKPLFGYWMKSPQRRTYQEVVFVPGDIPSNFYNLWRGFAVEPRAGDCSRLLKHIHEIICRNDSEGYRYLLAWMAKAVQCPLDRPGTAIVLRGGQGTGKGTFIQAFGSLFGEHYIQLSQSRHVVGNFNSHLKNALIVFADEAFWAGDKQSEGVIKALITESQMVCEMKGKDAVIVPNYLWVMISSNNDWVVPADADSRRFVVFDVADTVRQDTAYFSAIEHELRHGGREAFLHYLQNYDDSGLDLRIIPHTEGLLNQKLLSLDNTGKFWYDGLWCGALTPNQDGWVTQIPTEEVYQAYCEFARQIRSRQILCKAEFGKILRKYCPGIINIKKRSQVINPHGYAIDRIGQHYLLPTLLECRQKFDQHMGIPISWPPMDSGDVTDSMEFPTENRVPQMDENLDLSALETIETDSHIFDDPMTLYESYTPVNSPFPWEE